MRTVRVPVERWERWLANFSTGHGPTDLVVDDGRLRGRADDGAQFTAALPFSRSYDGPADGASFATAAGAPERWGLLLVRKGGFAVAAVSGGTVGESKVGQRHVQGRTKAGGQSQQRFARRRANQARAAFEAAADHAARVLAVPVGAGGPALDVVVGGDRPAVEDVLGDPRLARVRVVGEFLTVPDPRRAVLDQAVCDARCLVVDVDNGPGGGVTSAGS